MQEQYTQGPWDNSAPHEQTIKSNGKDIAIVSCSNKNWKANARLIAAAPELLEALSELVAMNNCNYDRAIMQKAFEKAQSAINKAKGE